MDAHLDRFAANRHAVLAANRVLAGAPVIQTVISEELDALRGRLLTVLPLADEGARLAVSQVLRSWLVFVRVLVVDWPTEPGAPAPSCATPASAPCRARCARCCRRPGARVGR
ncbi:hypothetical protein ACFWIQ_10440 [Kitasatospora sp. NPDC127059]|uniref:hypothetical protein n=1 Tax=unclassified Kitasatospora TaxID=2633591 RepID=UPI0036513214